MYAHQVIDDFKHLYGGENNVISIALETIPMCQQFHFDTGVSTLIVEMASNRNCRDVLFQCNEAVIKTPYKYLWFDFNVEGIGKLAMTISTYTPEEHGFSHTQHEMMCFVKLFADNSWNIADKTVFINDGRIEDYNVYEQSEWNNAVIRYCSVLAHHAILLLNCKNIESEVIKAPEALNKKRRRDGKQEIFDYHVLNVILPSNKQGYREQSEPISHNRVHLCRGHFKEYTKEHPLFGKLTGLYWWQPYVRGQNKDGIVIKDYQIKERRLNEQRENRSAH